MFKFLKEKIGSWIKKSKEKIEEKEIKEEKVDEIIEKQVEKEEKEVEKEREETKEAKEELEEAKEQDKEKEIKQAEEELVKAEKELEEAKEELEKVEEEVKEEVKEKKPSLFQKLKGAFSYKIDQKDFNDLFEDLELLLLENNVALEVVEKLKSDLEKELVDKQIKRQELEKEIKSSLKNALQEIIIEPDDIIDTIKQIKEQGKGPFTILFFGINGAGKTTSIAKFAKLLEKNNLSCVLAAADTFRAASIEQLQIHADKLRVKMIKHDYGADPAAVGFDAIKYAQNHKIDAVLIDTAGRMHTKEDLLREMEKICRVTKPQLKVFVAEAIAGNDATEQARAFNEMIEIDGSILSKTDIDEKGGTIISISYVTHKPILYIGTGQNYEDLELFNKEKFIEQLGLD